jgi:predicted O-methyltransferase YrrM
MFQIKQSIRDLLARFLAKAMQHFALDPRYFRLWEACGFHVIPLGFYSPIPDTRSLSRSMFSQVSQLPGIDINEAKQLKLLEGFCEQFRSEYEMLSSPLSSAGPQYQFGNTSFESVDAELLYCMIRKFAPHRFVEIGSGHSTLVAARAMAKNREMSLHGTIAAIEPFPPSFLQELQLFPVDLKTQPVQEVPIEFFSSMESGDILFIDSSHVCKVGSDVQYEFLELLPRLNSGVIVHVHDIFLPLEYPRGWVTDNFRFWNEQYLLQAFLSGNSDFEVLWAGAWMHRTHADKLQVAFSSYDKTTKLPASFWMRRK